MQPTGDKNTYSGERAQMLIDGVDFQLLIAFEVDPAVVELALIGLASFRHD